jgi:hypothetical protein
VNRFPKGAPRAGVSGHPAESGIDWSNAGVNPYFDSTFAIGSSPPSRAAMASAQAVSPG